MASNLLGLPIGRLTHPTNPRPDAALALYGEGLKWLARFCKRLQDHQQIERISIEVADTGTVEPEALQRARNLVREKVPGVRESEDRRGFQLLHWDPVRANEEGKPIELSLEHEARLKPVSHAKLSELQSALAQSEGLSIGKVLFPEGSPDDRLILRRYQRDFGAQSRDRYFELKNPPAQGRLIPRMMSVRERIKTSDFMSWASSAGEMRALNFELPIVALGEGGVVARLEFNWIDELSLTVADFRTSTDDKARVVNPLHLASLIAPFDPDDLEPVLEHTTYREKYSLLLPAEADFSGTGDLPTEHRSCGRAVFDNVDDRDIYRHRHCPVGTRGQRPARVVGRIRGGAVEPLLVGSRQGFQGVARLQGCRRLVEDQGAQHSAAARRAIGGKAQSTLSSSRPCAASAARPGCS